LGKGQGQRNKISIAYGSIYMLTLIPFLKKVNDPRKNSGKRHPLWLILLLVVLELMFGILAVLKFENETALP
jgi:hypothetical protein